MVWNQFRFNILKDNSWQGDSLPLNYHHLNKHYGVNEMTTQKQKVIDAVIEQIKQDVHTGDYTAIEELLKALPVQTLQSYLPEID